MENTSDKESGLTSKKDELILENTETNKNSTQKRRGRPAGITATKKTATTKKEVTPAKVEETEVVKTAEETQAPEIKATPKVKTKKAVVKTEEITSKETITTVKKDEKMTEIKNENDVIEEKKEALKEAKEKFKEAVTLSLDEELSKVENVEIISSQFNKSSDFVENMLTKLMQHLAMSEIQGRKKVEDAVDGLLGDNIVNDIVTTTLGYVGGKAAKGYTIGTAPAVVVSGAVKGAYKKIVD
jgi:hypothetical protein